jgi:hypothetical protein
MNSIQINEVLPEGLKRELESTWAKQTFERLTVIVRDDASKAWRLFGCVLKPLTTDRRQTLRYRYENAYLWWDSIAARDVADFLRHTSSQLSALYEGRVEVEFSPGCEMQPVSSQNYWMNSPGLVYSWRPAQAPHPAAMPLLAPKARYYPDIYEAAKDWLQLKEYHGSSDARKGHLMLLLPETRAFIHEFSWSDDDVSLRLSIAGSVLASEQVLVQGAYWVDDTIGHVQEEVKAGVATLSIPLGAERLHLFLIGDSGTVYEQHREDVRFPDTKSFLKSRHRMSSERVAEALRAGEGMRYEFKEFVELPGSKKTHNNSGDRLKRLLRTVAAFANSEGGTILIGVSDDIRVVGVRDSLAKGKTTEEAVEAVNRYAGALRAHVTDCMYLPVAFDVSVVEHQNDFLVLVEVPPSVVRASVGAEAVLYIRHGASNRAVPPAEWTPRERDFFGGHLSLR